MGKIKTINMSASRIEFRTVVSKEGEIRGNRLLLSLE